MERPDWSIVVRIRRENACDSSGTRLRSRIGGGFMYIDRGQVIRIASLNIRSGQAERLKAALKVLQKVNLGIIIMQ